MSIVKRIILSVITSVYVTVLLALYLIVGLLQFLQDVIQALINRMIFSKQESTLYDELQALPDEDDDLYEEMPATSVFPSSSYVDISDGNIEIDKLSYEAYIVGLADYWAMRLGQESAAPTGKNPISFSVSTLTLPGEEGTHSILVATNGKLGIHDWQDIVQDCFQQSILYRHRPTSVVVQSPNASVTGMISENGELRIRHINLER